MFIVLTLMRRKLISSIKSFESSLSGRYCTISQYNINNSSVIQLGISKFSPSPSMPLLTLSRGLKYKNVLTKRCEHCYFRKIEDRWYVFCDKFPRHKQAQRIDEKSKWIITHCTHGVRKY